MTIPTPFAALVLVQPDRAAPLMWLADRAPHRPRRRPSSSWASGAMVWARRDGVKKLVRQAVEDDSALSALGIGLFGLFPMRPTTSERRSCRCAFGGSSGAHGRVGRLPCLEASRDRVPAEMARIEQVEQNANGCPRKGR